MLEEVDRKSEGLRLTHSQLQIWVGQRLHSGCPLYNMAFAWIFSADLKLEIFQRAWRRVADSSDVLRARFVEQDGAASWRIADPSSSLTEVHGATLDEAAFRRWSHERCAQALDPKRQLVDSVLVRLADGRTGWYLNLHHLITDAWSTVLLYRQVAAEYAALLDGSDRPEALPTYAQASADLTAKAGNLTAAQKHWAQRLEPSNRSIPFYGRDAEPVITDSTRLTLELDEDRSRALDRLCGEDGFLSLSREMSRFAIFATLLLGWLHRISGRSDLGFDAPVAGRPTPDAKRALGLFIEMFPFAVDVAPQETFRSIGAKCLEESALFLSHARPGTSSPSGAVASNVVLNYFPESFGDFAGLPAAVEWVHPGHGDSVHALRLQVHDFGATGRLTFHFDFNDRVLPDHLRRRSLRHFESLLDALLDDPDSTIAAVDVLTDDERQALVQLNATTSAPLPQQTVVDRFLEQAGAEPSRIALRQGSDELSFDDLRRRSEALAATLVDSGVEPGNRVAILSRRSIDTVVAILAILRARAAYVPIDPAYPVKRRQSILQDSGAHLLLLGDGVAFDPATDLDEVTVRSISEALQAGQGTTLEQESPRLNDLAYVLYTSGSTGRPKGVLIEHLGLADYLAWAESQYVRGERLRFPLFTSLSFDLTVTSLFLPLITGGELRIYPEPEAAVDSALVDVLRDDAVDFIKLTPSHLSLLVQMAPAPTQIRRMVVGGEDFKTRLASDTVERLGATVEITNEYGPTEAVVGCVAHRFDPNGDTGERVPIGGPADHVRVEVLNHTQTPVPEGVPGELWISRPGLARGYLGLDELTAERFQKHPQRTDDRRYRTGDRVRLLDAHRLEYLGRIDRQLKISGFRIEPAEIEAALLSMPGIEQCAVVAQTPRAAATKTLPVISGDDVQHCERCGLPSNHPQAVFDADGICSICRSYDQVKEHAQSYFKTMDDLRAIFEASARQHSAKYDCMMLLSGGKDSTYALSRLVDLGLSVYAFTLDNGFISDGAKDNIRRITQQLGVPVEFGTTPAMNAIFRDSLTRFSNVCQGCFKTIYTLSTQRAKQLGIPIIVTGLSRGQMFETRLTEEMFAGGRRSAEEIDAAVLAARKVYHRVDDEVSRSLDVEIFQDDRIFDEIQYVDFYRYCDVGLSEMYTYLKGKVLWVRPEDTGRSTNCLINDLGIHIHKQQRGYHNYALPYSWDVRMGHKTRDEAMDELDDEIDDSYVRRTLNEIGSGPELQNSEEGRAQLAAFYVATNDVSDDALQEHLAERLPPALIPTVLERLEKIPLTAHGKVDENALPRFDRAELSEARYVAPDGPVAEYLAEVWQEQLGIERVGAEDHFFRLGGTSLGAMEVMIQLCREFDIDLPLETLFTHATLDALAYVAEERILADAEGLGDSDFESVADGESLPIV